VVLVFAGNYENVTPANNEGHLSMIFIVPAFQELDDAMSEIKKRANHVRTNLKTMELAIEEQEKVDKTR
jgi:hypothetical protein